MKAMIVTNRAAGTAGMQLVDRPEPRAATSDVLVEVHASGFVGTELSWPETWTDRLGRDRTPSIPGHELAGVVTALGYGTTGLSLGQRSLAVLLLRDAGAILRSRARGFSLFPDSTTSRNREEPHEHR